jgi:hypothetical protein
MKHSNTGLGNLIGGSFILLGWSAPLQADYVWLGKITGESDLGKRYSIYNGDAASLFAEANWENTANPGNPAPADGINNSSQPIAGINAPLIVNNGGVAGGTNGAGTSTAHLRTNGHALTVTGPGSGMKMSVDPSFRAMIQNDGTAGGALSPLTIADGAYVLSQQLQDIEVTISGTGSRLFIGSNSAVHAGLENSTIALTGLDETSPEIHFINNTIANVLLVLPSITINGSPAVAGSDPFRIEPGDNVIFSPRADYSFANFKQLDGQQTAPTSGVSLRAITPLTPSYWDLNGDTAGAGGETPSGTWDTTAAQWTSAAAGDTTTAAWTDGSVAAFSAGSDATGLYTVTLAAPRSVSGLLVDSGDLELAGAALDFSSAPLVVGNLAFLTLTSTVTGTPASRIEAGSKLLLNADQTLGSLRGYGEVSCDSLNLVIDHSGVASFSGSFQTSTGIITKKGSGDLRLNRAFHIIGSDIIVEAGTLTLAKDQGNQGALTSAPLFRVKAGATLDISSAPVTLGTSQQLAGAGTVAAANRTTWTQPAGNNFAAQVAIVTDALTVLGTIDPGDEGIGQLAIPQGTVNLLAGSLVKIEIDDASTPKSDKLLLGGALKIQSGAALELDITGTPTAASYELIQYNQYLGIVPSPSFTVVNLPAGYRIENHYNGNTVALVKNSPFDAWATANGIPGASFTADGPDKDGIANGVEYALGLNPTAFDALPALAPATGDFTWTLPKGAEAAADPGIGYFFEISENLSDWTKVPPTSQDGSSFSFLLPGGQGRQFVRIVIDQL